MNVFEKSNYNGFVYNGWVYSLGELKSNYKFKKGN